MELRVTEADELMKGLSVDTDRRPRFHRCPEKEPVKRMRSGQGGGGETRGSDVSEAKRGGYFKKSSMDYAKKLKQKTKRYPLDWATLKPSVASAKELFIGV